ncbi:unnamed protein product [Schistosoma curassoni]|uniref:Coiled-coil domain-containing protein 86 n=1 Tax=Schistosoma curassoni TaxID=6186 RepID=A0A183K2X5_9TREM|nr:unnamed protein product [Schistosoma curassoni]
MSYKPIFGHVAPSFNVALLSCGLDLSVEGSECGPLIKPSALVWAPKKKIEAEIKKIRNESIERKKAKDELKRMKRLKEEEKHQRKLENERRSEIVVPITNPAKLKRLRKKQMRTIVTR